MLHPTFPQGNIELRVWKQSLFVGPRSIMRRHLFLWLVLAVAPVPGLGQQQSPDRPLLTLALGVGNHYGWFGTGAEVYTTSGRVSLLAGLGITPPGSVAAAAGFRVYVTPARSSHRIFADVSMSVMGVGGPDIVGARTYTDYGPGLAVGYGYHWSKGLTLTAGGGLGATDLGPYGEILPVVHLGVGWTWFR